MNTLIKSVTKISVGGLICVSFFLSNVISVEGKVNSKEGKPEKIILIAGQICRFGVCIGVPEIPKIIPSPMDLLTRALTQVMSKNIPIASNDDSLFPIVSTLPGSKFQPTNQSLLSVYTKLKKSTDGTAMLKAGDYEIPMFLYCMKHSATSPSGHYYYLTRLKGSRAKVITALNTRAIGSDIPQNKVQVLSWNIQAGLPYQGMSADNRAIIDHLIPEYRSQLKGDFLDELESTINKYSIPGISSFDVLMSKLGKLGTAIKTYKSFRSSLKQFSDVNQLTRQLIRPGGKSNGGPLEGTSWSKIGDGVYGRLLVKTNALGTGILQLRVLPKSIGSKQVSKTDSDTISVPITSLVADPKDSNIQPISFTPAIKDVHPCNDDKILTSYDNTNPQYHKFTNPETILICSKEDPGCTKEKVFNLMISQARFVAPTPSHNPVESCKERLLIPAGGFKNYLPELYLENRIKTVINKDDFSITNYTLPGHIFYPGEITRKVVQTDSGIIIETTGEGVGDNKTIDVLFSKNGLWYLIDEHLKEQYKDNHK